MFLLQVLKMTFSLLGLLIRPERFIDDTSDESSADEGDTDDVEGSDSRHGDGTV